jgi:hypothetical protein
MRPPHFAHSTERERARWICRRVSQHLPSIWVIVSGETDTACLCSIITALFLGHIRSVTAHAGCNDSYAASLSSEDEAGSANTVVGAIKVDGPDTVPALDGIVQTASFAWDSSIGNP